jgi:hypothetical protein
MRIAERLRLFAALRLDATLPPALRPEIGWWPALTSLAREGAEEIERLEARIDELEDDCIALEDRLYEFLEGQRHGH